MSRAIRSTLAALALGVLVAGAAQALPRSPARWPEAPRLFDSLREWAAARLASVLEVREKAGGEMDPNGAKAGSDMDPNGAPHPLAAAPGATTEAGCDMDPNG